MSTSRDDFLTKSIKYMQRVTEEGLAIEGFKAGIINGFEKGPSVKGAINRRDATLEEQKEDAQIRTALVGTFMDPQIIDGITYPMSPVSVVMLNYLAEKVNSGEFKEQDCETWIKSAYFSLSDFAVKLYKHVYLGEGPEVKLPAGPPGIESLFVVLRSAVVEKSRPGDPGEWSPPWVVPAINSETKSAISTTGIPNFETPALKELKADKSLKSSFETYKNQLMTEWVSFSDQPHTVTELSTKKNEIMQHIDLLRVTTNILSGYKTEKSSSKSDMIQLLSNTVLSLSSKPDIATRNESLLKTLEQIKSKTSQYKGGKFFGQQNFSKLVNDALESKAVKKLKPELAKAPWKQKPS